MSKENLDTYDQEDRTYQAAGDSINSETMEKKDPAINQHEDDSRGIYSDTDSYERNTTGAYSEENENTDLNAKDDEEDEFDIDANRRTLDEEEADEDEDEIE